PRILAGPAGARDHRRVAHFPGIREALVTSLAIDSEGRPRPFPLQVDGDYIGERHQAHIRIAPGALRVLA
ncbi:MAG TPA: hypothetical protein VFD37_02860, partial [Solirubrobacterales bacterium]|nr:hypothetical protein [Solirubrobacterales bacterium]